MSALEYSERAWLNPFDSDAARAHSSYHGWDGGHLVRLMDAVPPTPFALVAHDAFRSFVLDEAFSCLGAKSAIRRGTYRLGVYSALDDHAATEGLARDLHTFVSEARGLEGDFTTFVAIFRARTFPNETSFECALWSELQQLHELDARHHFWDPRVADDPSDSGFSFSIAEKAFFIVGLHPEASRSARRFAWPALVFNAHEQFEHLRETGRFGRLQSRIRERETLLDGRLNPNLADHGQCSEARQYSGRAAETSWMCPFSARK